MSCSAHSKNATLGCWRNGCAQNAMQGCWSKLRQAARDGSLHHQQIAVVAVAEEGVPVLKRVACDVIGYDFYRLCFLSANMN
jgi:hypothetical protein